MSQSKAHHKKFKERLNHNIIPVIGLIIWVVMIISYLLALISIIAMNMIPLLWGMIVLIVSASVVVILALFSIRKKKTIKGWSISIILAVIVIILSLLVFYYATATRSFIVSNTKWRSNVIEYRIVAKKASHIKLSSKKTLATGLWTNDPNADLVKAEVDKLTKPTYDKYIGVTELIAATLASEMDIAVLQSEYLRNIEDEDFATYNRLEVLATFAIKIPAVDTDTETTNISKPFAVYISGIDTYGDIASVSRSDVNMIFVVDPVKHKILIVNTPRDFYVQLHGTTGMKDKLTHAGVYGITMSEETLEDLYGIDINNNVRINFSSLTKIVDTIGGVDVDSEYAFSDHGYSFNKGINHVNGKEALAFSRARHPFADGDRTRGQNQQRMIKALIQKLTAPSTLMNYPSILNAMDGAFQTNLRSDQITTLIKNQLRDNKAWPIETISVTGEGGSEPTYSMGSQRLYVMIPDENSVNDAKIKIAEYLNQNGAE